MSNFAESRASLQMRSIHFHKRARALVLALTQYTVHFYTRQAPTNYTILLTVSDMHYKRITPITTQSAKPSKLNITMCFGVLTSFFKAKQLSYTDIWTLVVGRKDKMINLIFT